MPFDSNGKFTLVGGNPVIPGSKISSTWANNTLADIANALSQTMIRRSGTVAPMHLNNDQAGFLQKLGIDTTLQDLNNRLKALEAESKAGIGIMEFVGHQNLAQFSGNYLICDGRPVSRTEYADLFAVIGTTWGIGNGSTTFNLPDMRGVVPRGFDNGRGFDPGRSFASTQADEIKQHGHSGSAASAGSHTHPFSGSTDSAGSHSHSISGTASSGGSHSHPFRDYYYTENSARTVPYRTPTNGYNGNAGPASGDGDNNYFWYIDKDTSASGTHTHSISGTAATTGAHSHSVSGTVSSAGSHTHSVTVGNTGGSETRMKNVAGLWVIKYKSGGDVQLLNALTNSGGDNLINPLGSTLTGGVII